MMTLHNIYMIFAIIIPLFTIAIIINLIFGITADSPKQKYENQVNLIKGIKILILICIILGLVAVGIKFKILK